MESETLMFAQVMTVIVLSMASFVAIGLGARVLWRMGSRMAPKEAPYDEERLHRLETAVDAIAIEVERISESQRFMVGLLSGPSSRSELAPVRRERMDTPH